MELHLLVGPPATGKSHLTRMWGDGRVISSDVVRFELTGDETNQEKNSLVFSFIRRLALSRIAFSLPVVLDSTHVQGFDRLIVTKAQEAAFSITSVVMTTPRDVSEKRNAARPRPVPSDVCQLMWDRFLHMDFALLPGRVITDEDFLREMNG